MAAVIWTGTVEEYRALLTLRAGELEVAISRLTGNKERDYFPLCRIATLEPQIADLQRWLAEAEARRKGV